MNLGQVYTRRIVADYMVGLFSIAGRSRVLDPCFGHGVFVESILDNTDFYIDGIEIDESSYSCFKNPCPERCALKQGDFFDVEGVYDGVVMNPPYVRHEEIDSLAPIGVTKKKLQKVCEMGMMTISGRANLYMYFIFKAVTLLRDGGELVAIFPRAWINTPV